MLARVWIAQAGAWLPQAVELLDRLLEDAEAKGRMGSVVEILIVRARAQWRQETHTEALLTLERALLLATPEAFVRRFVDEGPVIAMLLQAVQARGIAPDYITQLLAAFPEPYKETKRLGERKARETDARAISLSPSLLVSRSLVEPLSARELEVLRLIAGGMSNADVARTLVIAISTVKTHTNSIFGKLQATSRTQAIALARDLHLL
jgi:LuxR family maltose regulon positive regulatory protein